MSSIRLSQTRTHTLEPFRAHGVIIPGPLPSKERVVRPRDIIISSVCYCPSVMSMTTRLYQTRGHAIFLSIVSHQFDREFIHSRECYNDVYIGFYIAFL